MASFLTTTICIAFLGFSAHGLRLQRTEARDCEPTKGTWRRIQDPEKNPPVPDSYFHRFHPDKTAPAYTEEMLWEWTPSDDSKCALTKATHTSVCTMLEKRNLTHMTFVGDSLNHQMALSLFNLMEQETGGFQHPKTLKFGFSNTHKEVHFPCPSSDITFTFVRNDRLADNTDAKELEYPWWESYAKNAKQTLLVVDMGTHYHEKAEFQQDFDKFMNLMKTVDPGMFVFRSTPPGHDKCTKYKKPFTSKEQFKGEYKDLSRTSRDKYTWHLMPEFNAYAKQNFPQKPNYMVLDVYDMSILRPDAHKEKDGDCLHLKQPGVPDWWNHLLITELQNLE